MNEKTKQALELAKEALLIANSVFLRATDKVPKPIADAVEAIDEALAQDEKFCDGNCVWTDHHPNCKLAQPAQEPAKLQATTTKLVKEFIAEQALKEKNPDR